MFDFSAFEWVGVILLLGSLGGLLTCQKMKANPSTRVIGALLGVVMIIGIGLYVYGFISKEDKAIAMEREFAVARAARAGKAVKDANKGISKVLYLVNYNWDKHEQTKAQIEEQVEAFKKYSGCQDVKIVAIKAPANEEEADMADILNVAAMKEVMDNNKGVDLIVSDIGIPGKERGGKSGVKLFEAKNAPYLFLMSLGNAEDTDVNKLFKGKGKNPARLIGFITSKPKADYEKAPEKDPLKSFEIRNILRTSADE